MLNSPMNREQICARIPHSDSMCLLESVVAWDDESIHCSATSHCDPENPLRRNNQLAAISAAEYAAQAMAVHGSLLSAGEATPGFLAALRNVVLHVDTLHDHGEMLSIHATRLAGDSSGFIYTFNVHADNQLLVEGRATVFNRKQEGSS